MATNGTATPTPEVDLSAFRSGLGGPGLSGPATVPLSGPRASFLLGAEAHVVAQLGYGLDPRRVPVQALQLMSSNPAVYLAERIVTGVIRRPDLFSVRHDDPAYRAEVEAWMWPLLPRLASSAARAFAYGASAVVLDWGRKQLLVRAPQPDEDELAAGAVEPAPGTMVATPPRTVFVRVVEAHPDLTGVDLDVLGEQVAVRVGGQAVGIDRAHVWSWDAEFGELVGQGARRRAWRDYCEHLIVTLLRDKYLERSVDPVRKGRAPDGKTTVDGVTWEIPGYVAYLLDTARGSGQVVLPSKRDEHGEFIYDFELLEVSADRAQVFSDALNKIEANLLLAYLVAATFAGNNAEAGANQVLDGLLRDHVEAIATMVAQGLTRLAGIVHRANYPATVAEPEIVATDVGKATARKIYLDVLRLVTQSAQGEVAVRTDVPKLLDKLGVDVREEDDAPESATTPAANAPGQVGRPADPFGGRQDRRESAPPGSPGETSTGAPVGEDGTEETQGGGSAGPS